MNFLPYVFIKLLILIVKALYMCILQRICHFCILIMMPDLRPTAMWTTGCNSGISILYYGIADAYGNDNYYMSQDNLVGIFHILLKRECIWQVPDMLGLEDGSPKSEDGSRDFKLRILDFGF
jgi:hypothetical protein